MSKRRKTSAKAARRDNSRPEKKQKIKDIFVPRPFEGLADEVEWIAMRELVPAATAPLTLAEPYAEQAGEREVILATVLPLAWPAMTKPDGRIFIGLQRQFNSGDVSRDLAAALISALNTEPGKTVDVPSLPGQGPRLQDLLVDGALDITLYDGFDFWLDEGAADDPNVQASMEKANEAVYPTARMAVAPGAYWCQVPDRAHIRWVLPEAEDTALTALSRLGGAGALTLGEGTKFAGMFRAHGLLAPVWDLPRETEAAGWEQPLQDFAKRYAEALAAEEPLNATERRARQGLLGRQLTIR